MGIELTSEAWEAETKTLKAIDLAALSYTEKCSSWKRDGNSRPLQIAPLCFPHFACRVRMDVDPFCSQVQ
jgi:hypothetical protein